MATSSMESSGSAVVRCCTALPARRRAGKRAVAPACPLDDLIADRNDDPAEAADAGHARERSFGAHEGENKNADKNHDEEKARSAPRMEARLHARVLHRERKPRFVAENGFMLRAVIHPHALHIRDHRAELEISEKDRKAENTLGKTAPYAERHEPVQKTREKRRQQGEKPTESAMPSTTAV